MTTNQSESGSATPFTFETSRRGLLALGGAGLTAWLLASCSSDSSNDSSSSQSGGQPKKGGTLQLAFSDASADDSLDPGHILTTSALVVINSVFDQLATFGDDYAAKPALAKSWEVS